MSFEPVQKDGHSDKQRAAMVENNGAGNESKKFRLLFISRDKYPPFRVDVSVLFGKEIVRRGHSIDWILQSEEDCRSSYETSWSDCQVWVGSTNNGTTRLHRLDKYLRDMLHDFKIWKLIRKSNYDVVQVKDKFFSALVALLASKMYKTRFVYWLSYPYPEADLYAVREGVARYPFFYSLRGRLFKFLLYSVIMRYADHVFVQSEQMKRDVIKEGIPADKLTAVPMGIDLESIDGIRPGTKESSPHDEKNIVYLGTLVRDRKLDFLIRVVARVLEKVPDAKLYFVGGGEGPEDIELLMAEAKMCGIDESVIFTGFLERDKAFEIVRKADVCVSPFYPTQILNSTSPTKLIEYMAMGKAVVANDHPEQSLVIDRSGAGLCVPYSEEPFADAIVYLLENPDVAADMGRKGREFVEENRSYERIGALVENKYLALSSGVI